MISIGASQTIQVILICSRSHMPCTMQYSETIM